MIGGQGAGAVRQPADFGFAADRTALMDEQAPALMAAPTFSGLS